MKYLRNGPFHTLPLDTSQESVSNLIGQRCCRTNCQKIRNLSYFQEKRCNNSSRTTGQPTRATGARPFPSSGRALTISSKDITATAMADTHANLGTVGPHLHLSLCYYKNTFL